MRLNLGKMGKYESAGQKTRRKDIRVLGKKKKNLPEKACRLKVHLQFCRWLEGT